MSSCRDQREGPRGPDGRLAPGYPDDLHVRPRGRGDQ
jgi:hypothetical protein